MMIKEAEGKDLRVLCFLGWIRTLFGTNALVGLITTPSKNKSDSKSNIEIIE